MRWAEKLQRWTILGVSHSFHNQNICNVLHIKAHLDSISNTSFSIQNVYSYIPFSKQASFGLLSLRVRHLRFQCLLRWMQMDSFQVTLLRFYFEQIYSIRCYCTRSNCIQHHKIHQRRNSRSKVLGILFFCSYILEFSFPVHRQQESLHRQLFVYLGFRLQFQYLFLFHRDAALMLLILRFQIRI